MSGEQQRDEAKQLCFENVNQASRWLLAEAGGIAKETRLDFAICGGWSTVLRNDKKSKHPGTRDVDLLFSKGATPGALRDAVKKFLDRDFIVSAKHDFQVLRVLSVLDQNLVPHDFVFNVDFLHPSETLKDPTLFSKHLELSVPIDDLGRQKVILKSICLPSAAILFDAGLIEKEQVKAMTPDGRSRSLVLPVINEVGLLITKAKSCISPKRPRDIFDIYLAIAQPKDKVSMRNQLMNLRNEHADIFKSIHQISEALKDGVIQKESRHYFEDAGIDCNDAAKSIDNFLQEWFRLRWWRRVFDWLRIRVCRRRGAG